MKSSELQSVHEHCTLVAIRPGESGVTAIPERLPLDLNEPRLRKKPTHRSTVAIRSRDAAHTTKDQHPEYFTNKQGGLLLVKTINDVFRPNGGRAAVAQRPTPGRVEVSDVSSWLDVEIGPSEERTSGVTNVEHQTLVSGETFGHQVATDGHHCAVHVSNVIRREVGAATSRTASRMSIGLAMIVRDEAGQIERAITQALPIVSHVSILDTGSTDGTQEIARDLGADVHEREWDGFGPGRTALLQFAQESGTDYTLMLDADHVLHIEGDRPDLEADEYMLRVRDDGGRLPLLTRTNHPFRYEGVAHSYLATDEPATIAHTDWLSIDGGPGASREKLLGDLRLLQQAHVDDPTDARTAHYLAQTYRDLDMVDAAIAMYRKRTRMTGWPEETYWARYQLGCLLAEHVSFQQGAHHLLAAWESRPTRVEALRALANSANAVAAKLPIPDDVLFVQHAAYAATT